MKTLTNIIPQKNYSSIYTKEGFYIFSKRLEKEYSNSEKALHYKLIEDIFTFVATEFVQRGEQEFVSTFHPKQKESESPEELCIRAEQLEENSKEKMFIKFQNKRKH